VRLDAAYKESSKDGPLYLFFSVNGSGCFCGLAEMTSALDYDRSFNAWSQDDKWSGQFNVKWIIIKNVPNKRLRHIRILNNSNKPVTNSRDTQEIPLDIAKQMLRIFWTLETQNSLLDEFDTLDRAEQSRQQQKVAVKAKIT